MRSPAWFKPFEHVPQLAAMREAWATQTAADRMSTLPKLKADVLAAYLQMNRPTRLTNGIRTAYDSWVKDFAAGQAQGMTTPEWRAAAKAELRRLQDDAKTTALLRRTDKVPADLKQHAELYTQRMREVTERTVGSSATKRAAAFKSEVEALRKELREVSTAEVHFYAPNERGTVLYDGQRFQSPGAPLRLNLPSALLRGFPKGIISRDSEPVHRLLLELARPYVMELDDNVDLLPSIMAALASDRMQALQIRVQGTVPANPGIPLRHIKAGLISLDELNVASKHHAVKADVREGELIFVSAHETARCLQGVERVEDSCTQRAVMQVFGDAFAAAYKKQSSQLTIDSMLRNTGDGSVTDRKRSVHDMLPWFKERRLGFTVLTTRGEVVLHWTPTMEGKSRNKHLSVSHGYFLLHNNHLSPLQHDTRSLGAKLAGLSFDKEDGEPVTVEASESEVDEVITACRARFTIGRIDAESCRACPSLEDTLAAIAEVCTATTGSYQLHSNADLEQLHYELRQRGYEPQVQIYKNSVSGLVIDSPDLPRVRIKAFPVNLDEPVDMMPGESYAASMAWTERLFNAMFAESARSTYSDSLKQLLTDGARTPLVNRLDDIAAPGSYPGVDIVRAYTHALVSLENIPVFAETDEELPYDGHPIEPLNIYRCKNTDGSLRSWFVADTRICAMSGLVLKEARSLGIKLEVISFVRPLDVMPNRARAVIKEMYASDLPDRTKKFLVNAATGVAGKKYSRKQEAVWTESEAEAWAMCKPGRAPYIAMGGFLSIIHSSKAELRDGHLPLYFLVTDLARLMMLKMYDRLAAAGARVLGVKVDNLYVDHRPDCIELCKTKRFEDLGKPHAEEAKPLPDVLWTIKPGRLSGEVPSRCMTTQQVTEVLRPGTLVQGQLPGSGKTYLLTTTLPKGSTLFVCTTNEQCVAIQATGHKAVTVCSFLGQRLDDSGRMHEMGRMKTDEFKTMVINECYAVPIRQAIRLVEAAQLSGLHVYADGDCRQITPVGCSTNPCINRELYLSSVYAPILPYKLVLSGSHRLRNPDDVQRMVDIGRDIDEGVDILELIAKHSLRTCSKLEEVHAIGIGCCVTNLAGHIASAGVAPPENEDLTVLAKRHHRYLTTNRRYTVVTEDSSAYYIECDDHEDRWITKDYFRLPHFQTVDALQGSTIDRPYCILEAHQMTADRLWVAISRCRRLTDVVFYVGSELSAASRDCTKFAHKDLASLKASGEACTLDGAWYTKQLAAQNYRCSSCKGSMDMTSDSTTQCTVVRRDEDRGYHPANCKLSCLKCVVE
jgi:hypothetical protein